MELSELYNWEIETVNGSVFHREDKRWQDIDRDTILRISLVPATIHLQQIDVFCHADNKFISRFGKGFLKQNNDFKLSEYAQCIETEQQRVWALSNGRVLVTHKDFNLRI